MKRSCLASSALSAALGLLLAGALGATEFGATHVVYEKATKMKKVETALFMSFLDQSMKSDQLGAGRRLGCEVAALGPGGALPVKGKVILRLEGTAASTAWRSSALARELDARGDVLFDAEAILGLVDEALRSDADPVSFRIDFDGGKGKKVAQVTVDCIHEPSGGA